MYGRVFTLRSIARLLSQMHGASVPNGWELHTCVPLFWTEDGGAKTDAICACAHTLAVARRPRTPRRVGGACRPRTPRRVGGACRPRTPRRVGGACRPRTPDQRNPAGSP